MYRSKNNVDKHVEGLLSKLTLKEFTSRAYSVARLYFDVGDYNSCRKYAEQYLTQKDNNAAAHKLLAQALLKLDEKEKAFEHFKISLNLDPSQTSLILDMCDLLTDDEVSTNPGRAKYWFKKAEATFPRHPITFRLRERLMALENPNPEALVGLLTSELSARPKDALLHIRLLKYYLQFNKVKEAFDHICSVEFSDNTFINNYVWYETLAEIVKQVSNTTDWLYQLVNLTVRERLCVLSLTETPSGTSKSLVESSELLYQYDQAVEVVCKTGAPSGFAEFHSYLLEHHRGQFTFLAATFLLKKAKKDQLSWRDACQNVAPLILFAWQTIPLDINACWLTLAPKTARVAVQRWFIEGTYRCSQAGHYLLSNVENKTQSFLDLVSQTCSGTNWRVKLYEKIFNSKEHLANKNKSHFISGLFGTPELKFPNKTEVEAYDKDGQKNYPNSLHHFVWLVMNYKDYTEFQCTLFDMLSLKSRTNLNTGPESLNKLDILAFLYSATITAQQQEDIKNQHKTPYKPKVLPCSITDLLCPLTQIKWWDCAYKLSQNQLGTELTDIRTTLTRGIEVVRCIDNHGLDPELLCLLGNIFSRSAKNTESVDEKSSLEARAALYYNSAIPILEKIKCKTTIKMPEKRMFDYKPKRLSEKEINLLIEESKLFVAQYYLGNSEYERALATLSDLKSPQAYFCIAQTYLKVVFEEQNLSTDNSKEKTFSLLSKAKSYAYKTLDKLKYNKENIKNILYSDTQNLIEEIEMQINKLDTLFSETVGNNIDGKYSDENLSSGGSENMNTNKHVYPNLSSTPKQPSNTNESKYRTAVGSQLFDNSHSDYKLLGNQTKDLQKSDYSSMSILVDQTKKWFEENQNLSYQIMSIINVNNENFTDQFKMLKISVDQVKEQINDCRGGIKDVEDLKKQLADLKKEVNKLKKTSSDQTIDDNDLYHLNEDRTGDSSIPNFPAQLPFNPPQVMPQFNQRLIPPYHLPPNPYQLYNQNLYNLYNQYSQYSQGTQLPAAPPMFDSSRPPVNYTGIFPTPEMYPDVSHLIPTNVQAVPTIPSIPTMSSKLTTPLSVPPQVSIPKPTNSVASKETSRSLPVNVVITSSDPLPACTTAPQPVLSVTIPSKHLKGTAHNYQIPMPAASDSYVMPPTMFGSGILGNSGTTNKSFTGWSKISEIKPEQSSDSISNKSTSIGNNITSDSILESSKTGLFNDSLNASANVTGTSNTNLNRSRTLSEKSNTSVDNYDPCPDFKPIVPLPAEVKVTTGEEDEIAIFSARAKLFRFDDKQWKERGIGEIKLLKHKITGKVRVLMRREQVHKICANHIISKDIDIQPMKNEGKAYFWAANDFADETVVLEKFCVRFKTPDTANQFYTTFKSAIQEANLSTSSAGSSDIPPIPEETTTKEENITKLQDSQSHKTVIGGFTFCSTPTFKSVKEETSDIKPKVTTNTKSNPFSTLSFKSNNTPLFTNLFNISQNNTSYPAQTQISPKLNTSDNVEDFEPTVEFKPVVPLPALIDHKTGEEDEVILFEHRAKLLRFECSAKEWKERGLGNIKILAQKNNTQKVRLLMRREQVMKVCCNHAITKDMIFEKMPNMDKAVTWCAKDFSEGELVPETFCLRFKTVQACDDFISAVTEVQASLKDDTKAIKEENNAAKASNQVGFGDKFKPKSGSWYCESCYTNNLETFIKCACCEQLKPEDKSHTGASTTNHWGDNFKPEIGSWECKACFVRNKSHQESCCACNGPKDPNTVKQDIKPPIEGPKFKFGIPTQAASVQSPKSEIFKWGDKFKPNDGSWECKQCLVRNEVNIQKCSACSSDRNPSTVKQQSKSIFDRDSSGSNLVFGNVQSIATMQSVNNETPVPSQSLGWGDIFKPKAESWECKECLVRNEGNVDQCTDCSSVKDSIAVKQQSKITFDGVASGAKYTFGIPPASKEDKKSLETTSIFSGTGAHKFSFGVPSALQEKTSAVFDSQKSVTGTGVIFASPKKPEVQNVNPLNLIKNNDVTVTPVKPALLPTPQKEQSTSLGNRDTASFDFVFKPKSTVKGKSPLKSPKSEKGYESDEYASEDEGHDIHFNPVIPLPDKVNVVTGEENEDELYGQRSKLYRFISGEWKERGIGIVKILKHKETGKLRVLMRREQVLKICLNHVLTPEINYTPKDEKSLSFVANDFSEGELCLSNFCIRFKTKELAQEFKDAIDKARSGKSEVIIQKEIDNDDVIFVKEYQATNEEKQKAKELMLPENYYTYKNKEPCQGCRGCQDDDSKNSNSARAHTTNETPVKTTAPQSYFSPTTSLYGTPENFNKTTDIFSTPFETKAQQSATNKSEPASSSSNKPINKENKFVPSMFSGAGDTGSIFSSPQLKPVLSEDTNASSVTPIKNSVFSAPKLNVLNFGKIQGSDPNTTFGSQQASSIFGTAVANNSKPTFGIITKNAPIFNTTTNSTDNKSVFGGGSVTSFNNSVFGNKANDIKMPEVKSIFGGDVEQKPVNLFSSAVQGSIFGPTANIDKQHKPNIFSTGNSVFGASQTSGTFGSGKALFGNINQNTVATFGLNTNNESSTDKPTQDIKPNNADKVSEAKTTDKDIPLNIDNKLTFAALSSSQSGFNVQKAPDFKWEGAGQQLFTAAQKAQKELNDKSKSGDHTADSIEGESAVADDEYDPHYEPIVPLPDKVEVTTGEEDEEKLFGERAKLYRYDDKTREWKERGVGEIKILYHPVRKTYRLLLRREQVHKAVLNMLLFMDLDLLPMKNSDRAWMWAGLNYAENASGEQETLSIRFKSAVLANTFRDKMSECVRKLQAAAAQAIREEKEPETKVFESVPPLRLPKHLESTSRADPTIISQTNQKTTSINWAANSEAPQNGQIEKSNPHVHFQEPEEEEQADDEGEDYEQNYEYYDNYEDYYNQDDEASHFVCAGEAVIKQGDTQTKCSEAHIQVQYDQEMSLPKILVTDSATGEILADMIIHTETEFQMDGDSCTWSGTDYMSGEPSDKTVTINFPDSETAMQFYDSCETSKQTTFSSEDPVS